MSCIQLENYCDRSLAHCLQMLTQTFDLFFCFWHALLLPSRPHAVLHMCVRFGAVVAVVRFDTAAAGEVSA